jgi:predicted PurR-regulated permease PerM
MSMARLVSLGIVTALIACLGITFYQVIAPFLMPLFLAAMIALRYFLHRCKGRRALAAGLSTAAIVGSVMLPLVVTVLLGILNFLTVKDTAVEESAREIRKRMTNVSDFVCDWTFWSTEVSFVDRQLFGPTEANRLGMAQAAFDQKKKDRPAADDALPKDQEEVEVRGPLEDARRQWLIEQFEKARGQSREMLKSLAFKTAGVVGSSLGAAVSGTVDLLGAIVGALVALFVFTLALYYFFLDGPDMVLAAQSLIPIEKAHQQELMQQFARSVQAVVTATFLAAVGQGLATALALQFVGMGNFFLFAIIATFSALIPMAGTWLVWVPCAIWLGVGHESWGSAAFLAVMGIGPIGMMDNVVRTWVLKNDTSLHPLLAFVSVLGGLQVMGLWGVFIGPIVACCLHSLIEIFNSELRDIAQSESPNEPVSTAPQPDAPETLAVQDPSLLSADSSGGVATEPTVTVAESAGHNAQAGETGRSGSRTDVVEGEQEPSR